MAQRDVKLPNKKQRPSSLKFQNSTTSHPTPTTPSKHSTPTPLTTPNYPLSPAEQYVLNRSEGFPTPLVNRSRETPSTTSLLTHDEIMNRWQQNKANEISKKQKHRYSYNTAPASSSNIPSQNLPSSIHFNRNESSTNRTPTKDSNGKLKIISAI